MILTFKIKHNTDFSYELERSFEIAEFVVRNKIKQVSSRLVTDIRGNLPAKLAEGVMRKYGRIKTIREVKNVNVNVPGQAISYNPETKIVRIIPLKVEMKNNTAYQFSKINQIELDKEYAYVSVTVEDNPQIIPERYFGIDRNTTGHIAVVACPETGKVYKFGKHAMYTREKYKRIRTELSKGGEYRKIKKISNREARIIRDTNHKISRTVVNMAREQKAGLVLEDLKGIRKRSKKTSKSMKHHLNSWSFYQLRLFIEYKAKMHGIPVFYVDPAYTSQQCSVCGEIGERDRKSFKCPSCGHVDHADANAAFNIALRHKCGVDCAQTGVRTSAVLVGADATPDSRGDVASGELLVPVVNASCM